MTHKRQLTNTVMKVGLFLIIGIGLILSLGAWAYVQVEEQSVRPGVNDAYINPDFELWQRRFESTGREVYDQREAITKALNITPDMKVADIGAGTGLFTRRFAKLLGKQGRVYAIDISKTFVEHILEQAKQSGLNNVVGIVNTDKDIKLTNDILDLAFVCDTYHHFEYPRAMLKSIYQALKKNGRLVVIDYRKDPKTSSRWVMGHVRADRDTVQQEIELAGFKYVKDELALQHNFFMVFRK